ncbi:hypothetical protein N0V91_000798 [Didymella pomorum]|uniref:Uncharacterized protein n=1 Tax=Didymella pomorum TaxID=749634 RepID=A0A9W8ZM29_9PLEO|nr:hypothetical protein N0V91_000798 [Didymella pomorum]
MSSLLSAPASIGNPPQEHFTVRDQLNGNKWLRCTRSEAVDYRDCGYKFFKANGQTFRPYASTGDVHPDAFCRQKEEIQNVENTLEDDESLTAVKEVTILKFDMSSFTPSFPAGKTNGSAPQVPPSGGGYTREYAEYTVFHMLKIPR